MGTRNENIEQIKAIKTIDDNVLVNAGAGTGKTKVLTDRYIEILENGNLKDGEEIESIVAITFTNKATQEMIDRIRSLIEDKMEEDIKWISYYRDMEKANISTIHGFCGDILRENPVEVNIDPYFEIADDTTSQKLLYDSTYETISEYLEKNAEFMSLLEIYEIDRIDNIIYDFISIYNQIRSYGVNFSDIRDDINSYLDELEHKDSDIEYIKNILVELVAKFRANSSLVKYSNTKDYMDFMNNNYEKDIYEYLTDIINNLGKSKVELELQEKLREKINIVMLSKEVEFRWMYNLIIDILVDLDLKYTMKKRKKGILDYDDLQIYVLKLFENEIILNKYREKFRYFLIDEFQDTNELQRKIFYKLTSVNKPLDKKNLFVVGDPKQSIYGFRGANVNIFYEVIKDIKTHYNPENIITLKTNYRSVDTVMEFVNDSFKKLMGLKYDSLDAHNKSDNDIDVEVILDEELDFSEESKYESDIDYEANMIAKRIKTLIEEGYQYGDIAILFRSTTRVSEYETILKKYDIPYYNNTSKLYYMNQEIIDLITCLKVISNPSDVLSFIGILRSPMFGINDDTIYKIVKIHNSNNNSFLRSIEDVIGVDISEEEKGKLVRCLDIVKYLLVVKNYYNIVDLVDELIDKTEYISSAMLKEDGEQISANIYKFKDIALENYLKNKYNLDEFIDFLESRRNDDESDEIIISEDDNVVKIMTIHSSKGLQYEAVFLPQMASMPVSKMAKFNYNSSFGLSIKNNITNGKYEQDKKKIDFMEKEELLRVYYVAMTRAESLLILGMQGRNSGIKKELLETLSYSNIRVLEDLDIDEEDKTQMDIINNYNNIKDAKKDYEFPLLNVFEDEERPNTNLYSITQYMVFNECRRKYFLKYIWDIDIKSVEEDNSNREIRVEKNYPNIHKEYIDGSTKGNIIHEFSKIYRNGIDRKELLEESINKFMNSNNKKIYGILDPYIDNYLEWYSEDYDDIYYEKPFYSKFENGYLYGIIDRVNISNEKVEIVDFKTNNIDKANIDDLNEYYEPQLLTYAYIAKQILKKDLSKVSILYLSDNMENEYNFSDIKLEENIKKINYFMNYVNENTDIEDYEMTNKCNPYCEHLSMCKRFI